MTNFSVWVTLHYFFARQPHQSCLIPWPTECKWHWHIALFLCHAVWVSSHDKQYVSDIAFLYQASIVSHPMSNSGGEWHCFHSLPGSLISHVSSGMTNREWVTLPYFMVWPIMSHPMTNRWWVALLYFNHVSSHDQQNVRHTALSLCQAVSCLMTNKLWVSCFISLPGCLINHVLSHDHQGVSNTALFLCQAQAVSSIMSHPMTNRVWVTFLCQTVSSITSHPITNRVWVHHFRCLCQVVSSIMSHPMTNRMWVTLLDFCARQNHVSSHDQQVVSDCFIFCWAMSSIMSMTNRWWVTALQYVFARHFNIPWPTDCKSYKVSTMQFWHLSSCDQQSVSDIQPNLTVTSLNMTNRLWVARHLCFIIKCHLIYHPMITNSKFVMQLLMNHITFYCISYRKWV